MIYTMVDEMYFVRVFHSLKKLKEHLNKDQWSLLQNSELISSTDDIVRILKSDGVVRLYETDATDWTFKLEKHR